MGFFSKIWREVKRVAGQVTKAVESVPVVGKLLPYAAGPLAPVVTASKLISDPKGAFEDLVSIGGGLLTGMTGLPVSLIAGAPGGLTGSILPPKPSGTTGLPKELLGMVPDVSKYVPAGLLSGNPVTSLLPEVLGGGLSPALELVDPIRDLVQHVPAPVRRPAVPVEEPPMILDSYGDALKTIQPAWDALFGTSGGGYSTSGGFVGPSLGDAVAITGSRHLPRSIPLGALMDSQGNVRIPTGYHVKKLGARKALPARPAGEYAVLNRRMNPLNIHALRRASRRLTAATRTVRHLFSLPRNTIRAKKTRKKGI